MAVPPAMPTTPVLYIGPHSVIRASTLLLAVYKSSHGTVTAHQFTVLLQENLHGQYQKWAQHFGHTVSHIEDAGFKVWADTVNEHLNSSRSRVLVNGHAAMSDADFRAAYLGQRSKGISLAR